MKNYETVLVLTPVLSEGQLQETVDKFRGFLQEKKATIIHEDPLGLRKLAYPIQHKSTGFYHLFEFTADPSIVHALETEYRRDERVLRFSTFALDKYGIAYNERKRSGGATEEQELKQEVAV